MRILIFVLLLLPGIVFGKNYKYGKLVISAKGNDNISIEKTIVREVKGNIVLNGNLLRIDNKHYKLRPLKTENLYKAKGHIFKLIFSNGELTHVELYNYDNVYSYCINESNEKGTFLSAR